MLTKRGIELDINKSKYEFKFLGFTFYFSSKFYLNKFKNNVKDYIEEENYRIYNKYKTPISLDLYFAVSYYRKIEKRGFRIKENRNEKNYRQIFFVGKVLTS